METKHTKWQNELFGNERFEKWETTEDGEVVHKKWISDAGEFVSEVFNKNDLFWSLSLSKEQRDGYITLQSKIERRSYVNKYRMDCYVIHLQNPHIEIRLSFVNNDLHEMNIEMLDDNDEVVDEVFELYPRRLKIDADCLRMELEKDQIAEFEVLEGEERGKVYTHYGTEVRRIVTSADIEQIVNEYNATVMPIINPLYKVAFYKHDGVHTTYMVFPREGGKYYLTNQIPKDLDFDRLIQDVECQSRGAKPEKMESYIHALYRHIEKILNESAPPVESFADENEPIPLVRIRDGFGEYGFFSFEDISSLPEENYWDVDMEYIKKIFE